MKVVKSPIVPLLLFACVLFVPNCSSRAKTTHPVSNMDNNKTTTNNNNNKNDNHNDTSSNNFTLINDTPLIRDNFTSAPAIVLFENFIFEKFNLTDMEARASNGNNTSATYAARFIQENLDNLYRNLNALNRFVTKHKYGGDTE